MTSSVPSSPRAAHTPTVMTIIGNLVGCCVLIVVAYTFRVWLIAHRKEKQLKELCPGGNKLWLYPLGALQLPASRFNYPLPGTIGNYYEMFNIYRHYGSTCVSCVAIWEATPVYYMTNVEAIKKVCSDRNTFIKDVRGYEMLNVYGPNVVSAEGDTWKRHRMIANPAFSEANNAMVWEESLVVIDDWLSDIDNRANPEEPINLVKEIMQVTLYVISSTAFGRRIPWKQHIDDKPPLGHTMAFGPAVTTALSRLIMKVLVPDFVFDFSARFYIPFFSPIIQETKASFDALRRHMAEIISLSRAIETEGKEMDAALLRNMVKANMVHDGKHLTDDELFSNTMTFLLAGQDTTAHTTSFTLSFLALYPDVQRSILDEVNRVWPKEGPPPSYKESLTQLEYTAATFLETLRVRPAVPRLGKIVQADTSITSLSFRTCHDGRIEDVKPFEIPIEKGTVTMVDIIGLHMNPIYWGADAEDFKPEHFIDTDTYHWPRDAFFGFSGGPRGCIGKRFAMAEATCLIASVVRKYEILLPSALVEKPLEEQKKIMLGWYPSLTSVPTGAKVVFSLRK